MPNAFGSMPRTDIVLSCMAHESFDRESPCKDSPYCEEARQSPSALTISGIQSPWVQLKKPQTQSPPTFTDGTLCEVIMPG